MNLLCWLVFVEIAYEGKHFKGVFGSRQGAEDYCLDNPFDENQDDCTYVIKEEVVL